MGKFYFGKIFENSLLRFGILSQKLYIFCESAAFPDIMVALKLNSKWLPGHHEKIHFTMNISQHIMRFILIFLNS